MDTDIERILVTGSQGLLGRYLAAWLTETFPAAQILGLGRSPGPSDAFTHSVHWGGRALPAPMPMALRLHRSQVTYVRVDLRNARALSGVVADVRPQFVFHLAAALRDDPPRALFESNVLGTMHLIEALAQPKCGARMAVLVSSGGVYGQPADAAPPLREDAACLPSDLYTTSKLAAEYAARLLAAQHRVPVTCARVFNVIGPGQDERHVAGRFASQIAAVMRGEAPPAMTVDDLHTTRDFIDVRDAVRALTVIAQRERASPIVNVGSGRETSIETVLNDFLRLADLQGRMAVQAIAQPPGAVRRQRADISRLAGMGFRCKYSLRRSCQDLLTYYLTDVADRARSPADATIRA